MRNGASVRAAVLAALVVFGFGTIWARDVVIGQMRVSREPVPLNLPRELALKISGPFSFASVGDLILLRPTSQFADPGFQGAIKLIKDADVAFGNFEASLSDIPSFNGPLQGFMGEKAVAADLKAMGFDMVNRANNHLFDSEQEGMWSTNALLDEAGLVHAGTGRNLDDARAARYLQTPKGRVALVGIHTPLGGNLGATPKVGNYGGRAGLNALNLTTRYVVRPEQLETLRTVRDADYDASRDVSDPIDLPMTDRPGELDLFGTLYTTAGTPGTKSYTMNAADLKQILRAIRNGKESSDFLVATIHAHQGPWVAQRWAYEADTPDFLVALAHQAIDNGADVFVGHGPHVVRGVEIYKGKPIFYGLGEFFRQMDFALPYVAGIPGLSAEADELTDVERMKQVWERTDTRAPVMYESVLAVSSYNDGQLAEVRLYPIDGRFDAPISRTGIPRLATGDTAARILLRVQRLSQRFNTPIVIDHEVGVIRVVQRASQIH
jgi:poly-gamma-glutamate capsule biosynthesis protein CapA/YwtB (metallophosphatase superfamily)